MKANTTIKAILMAALAAVSYTVPQAQAATAQQMQTSLTGDSLYTGYTQGNVYALTFTVNSYQGQHQADGEDTGFFVLQMDSTGSNQGFFLITTDYNHSSVYLSSDDDKPRGYNSSTQRADTWLTGTSSGDVNTYSATPSGQNYNLYGIFSQGKNRSHTVPTLNGATYTVAYDGTNTTIVMQSTDGVTNKAILNGKALNLKDFRFYSTASLKDGMSAIDAGTYDGLTNVYTWDGATGSADSWTTAKWKLAAADGQNFKNVATGTAYGVQFTKENAAATVSSNVRVGKADVKVDQTIAAESGATATFASTSIGDAKTLTLKSASTGTINLGAVTMGTDAKLMVDAAAGDLDILSANAALQITTMTIGDGQNVGVHQNNSVSGATILETLNAGGGTLTADLTMADGATLNLGGKALTMGADSSFNVGGIVNLDATTLGLIEALEVGESQLLVSFAQGAETDIIDGDWARTYFNLASITDADFKMSVEGNSIGIEKVSNVPEPATGTLSLLALAALAARRRRK